MRKALHEYSPEEIAQWQKGEYPSAQGRTWRRAVRETTYAVARATVPTRYAPVVDGIAQGLRFLPSPAHLMGPLLGSTLFLGTQPFMLELLTGAAASTSDPFGESLAQLVTTVSQVIHPIIGALALVNLVLYGASLVMLPEPLAKD